MIGFLWRQPPEARSLIALAFALGLLAAGSACVESDPMPDGDVQAFTRATRVETTVVQPRSFDENIQVTGAVEAINDATLAAQASGKVAYIAEHGDRVDSGAVVARLDGRGFTRLTKETLPLDRPFDHGFADHMVTTATQLMSCGFEIPFAYTQSDEISVWLHPDDATYARKTRKLLSVLAGEASATLSLSGKKFMTFLP